MTLREAVLIVANDAETDAARRIAACRMILMSAGAQERDRDQAKVALATVRAAMWARELALVH